MLITMKDAIARAIAFEEDCKTSPLINTSKGVFKGRSVKDAMKNQTIQHFLINYAGDKPISFPDNLSEIALDKAIDQFVIGQLTDLINRDFVNLDASKARFTSEQIKQFTANNPSLLFSLQQENETAVDHPYTYVKVQDFLPALVALENLKKPDLKLQFTRNEELPAAIGKWIRSGQERAHLVHLRDIEHHRHTQYFDCKLVDGIPSVLLLDCWQISKDPGDLSPDDALKKGLQLLRKDLGKELAYGTIEQLIQSSVHGCHVFGLNTAKQVYKDPKALDALHQKNVDNIGENRMLDADALLPAHFMKHAHSSKRLTSYMLKNEEGAQASVNRKGETLKEYRALHTLYHKSTDETLMRSIFQKRAQYLLELGDAFGIA